MYVIKKGVAFGLVVIGILGLGAVPAVGGQAVYLADDADYCDMFRALGRKEPRECGRRLRLRTIQLHDAMASKSFAATSTPGRVQGTSTRERTIPDHAGAMALKIPFAFDSAVLTHGAQRMLDEVAQVLTHETMQNAVIQIEGHADSRGTEHYNLILSSNRARSVQRYLSDRYGVAIRRIPAVGKGETEPFDWRTPAAGINRRVEFHYLGGADARL